MEDWVNYLKNEEGKIVISNDCGLIAFNIADGEMYITDLYVKPKVRKKGLALEMGKMAQEFAENNGCNRMTCNVFINEQNAPAFSDKIRIFAEFGFLPISANNNAVTMMKEL